jgi:hypothetical protein
MTRIKPNHESKWAIGEFHCLARAFVSVIVEPPLSPLARFRWINDQSSKRLTMLGGSSAIGVFLLGVLSRSFVESYSIKNIHAL